MRAALLLLALTGLARAAAPPTTILRAADQADFLFLLDGKPLTVRLHLQVGDRPFQAMMDVWSEKLFRWFDRDGDGFLSREEAGRALPTTWMRSFTQGAIRADAPVPPPLAELDSNREGKVSPAEFRAYLEKGFPSLNLVVRSEQADLAERVNQAILKRLEAARDGQVCEKALARLPGLMKTLDENEDELLTEREILQELGQDYGFGIAPSVTPSRPGAVVLRMDATTPAQVAASLLRHYGKGKKSGLSREDLGLDEAAFQGLDLDGDGRLDARELERFVLCPPALTFRARAGAIAGAAGVIDSLGLAHRMGLKTQRLTLLTPSARPLARSVTRESPEEARLTVGKSTWNLRIRNTLSQGRLAGLRSFYLRQYDMAGPDKVKGLTREQARSDPYVNALFPAADRDGDGQLLRTELSSFLSLMEEGSGSFVTVSVFDGGRSLFRVIDANGDGRLTMRELRSAWSRARGHARDGKGLTIEELPREVRVEYSEGQVTEAVPTPLRAVGGPLSGLSSREAPEWFRKMDRNGDGDLSPSEWLGSEEELKRLDADGDGLISVAEAMKAGASPDKDKKK
jgi:Ca2+-binding EF-hand superfamily protein